MLVRKALIIVSLGNVFFLIASLVILDLSVLPGFRFWSFRLEIVGILFMPIVFIFFAVYYLRQGRTIGRQVKQRGMVRLTQRDIFHHTTAEAKPYIREARLTLIVWVGGACTAILPYVVNLVIPYAIYPHDTEQQIQTAPDLVCFLAFPVSILVYAILSKDFTKNQRQ